MICPYLGVLAFDWFRGLGVSHIVQLALTLSNQWPFTNNRQSSEYISGGGSSKGFSQIFSRQSWETSVTDYEYCNVYADFFSTDLIA